jgi:hypothetical protein
MTQQTAAEMWDAVMSPPPPRSGSKEDKTGSEEKGKGECDSECVNGECVDYTWWTETKKKQKKTKKRKRKRINISDDDDDDVVVTSKGSGKEKGKNGKKSDDDTDDADDADDNHDDDADADANGGSAIFDTQSQSEGGGGEEEEEEEEEANGPQNGDTESEEGGGTTLKRRRRDPRLEALAKKNREEKEDYEAAAAVDAAAAAAAENEVTDQTLNTFGDDAVVNVDFDTVSCNDEEEVEVKVEPEEEEEEEKGDPEEKEEKGGLRDIETFYGHNASKDEFAVRYKGASTCNWLHRNQLHNTDPRWLKIAVKQRMPAQDRGTGEWRALKGGVLTRAERLKSASGNPLRQSSPRQQLCCLSTSYLNLACDELSDAQKEAVQGLELSETQLATKLSHENFPLRMTQPLWFTGAPRDPGDYLVSLSAVHTDALRKLPNGLLQWFPSNPAVFDTVDILSYLTNHKNKYQAIRLIRADRAELTTKQKRALSKKRKRSNLRKEGKT